MAHHAYVVEGEIEEGIARATAFATRELADGADVIVRRYGLFSVEDARDLMDIARLSGAGGNAKAIIISATRLFHEAQNAMLKLFEEPPKDTYLFLVVPSAGMLLPTMRSRVMTLSRGIETREEGIAGEYLAAKSDAREKLVAKLLDRTKSDKDEEKQRARADALSLAEGLARASHAKWSGAKPGSAEEKALRAYLSDLDAFIPILHERSAPLKLIFEHLALVEPRGLG